MVDTGRVRLAVRRTGPEPTSAIAQRPVLLVHGLASNARLWDGVAQRLGDAGHPVVAVDQRGHGRSDVPADGYDTETCAADLAALVDVLGWVDGLAPVAAGQSWGGNVVLTLAARHPSSTAAIALVDGGWLRLGGRFETFEQCWQVLAPPSFDGVRYDDLVALTDDPARQDPAAVLGRAVAVGPVLGAPGTAIARRLFVALELGQRREERPAQAVLEPQVAHPAPDAGLERDPAVNHAATLARLTELVGHSEASRLHPGQRAGEQVAGAVRALDGDDVPGEADQVSPIAVGREKRDRRLDVTGCQGLLERGQPALDLGAGCR